MHSIAIEIKDVDSTSIFPNVTNYFTDSQNNLVITYYVNGKKLIRTFREWTDYEVIEQTEYNDEYDDSVETQRLETNVTPSA